MLLPTCTVGCGADLISGGQDFQPVYAIGNKVIENMIMRRVFGPKWDENGDWRRLHNEKLHSFGWLICCLLAGPDLWKRMPLKCSITMELVLFFLEVQIQVFSGKIIIWQYFRFLSTSQCRWPTCSSSAFKDSFPS
jgi:hypothetical protein